MAVLPLRFIVVIIPSHFITAILRGECPHRLKSAFLSIVNVAEPVMPLDLRPQFLDALLGLRWVSHAIHRMARAWSIQSRVMSIFRFRSLFSILFVPLVSFRIQPDDEWFFTDMCNAEWLEVYA